MLDSGSPTSAPPPRRSWLAALALFLVPSTSFAGDLVVEAATGQAVVVLVDGEHRGTAPLTVADLAAGKHTVAFRGSNFGPTAFEQVVVVPEQGKVTVAVDLAARTATVAVAPLAPQSDATVPAATVAQAPEADAPVPPAPAPAAPEPPPPSGNLYVAADVTGASISVDGKDTGAKTPAMLAGVAPGKHEVRVATECARADATIEVRKDLIDRVELTLQAGEGALHVNSEPKGALVFLEGEQVGTTPFEAAAVPCAEHVVQLRAPGHLAASRTLRVPAFETTRVEVVLDVERYGTLVVAPMPLQATLSLDGIAAGSGPMTLEQVGAGPHELIVALDGYASARRTVDVAPDAVTRVDVALALAKATQRARPWGRIAANSAVTAAGVGLGAWSVATFGRARDQYQDFLDHPDDRVAQRIYDEEVRPRRTAAVVEGAGALAVLGSAAWLWASTDYSALVGPGTLTVRRRW